ncbi:MAG: helix-turn-helix domain-containing protein [Lacipirellulaceae bacterium]
MNELQQPDPPVTPNNPRRGDAPATRRGLLTVREGAEWLGCSVGNVYGLIEQGRLPVVRVGARRGYRLDPRDLDEFVEAQRVRLRSPERLRPPARRPLRHLTLPND